MLQACPVEPHLDRLVSVSTRESGRGDQWPRRVGDFDIVRTRSASYHRSADLVFDRPDLHFSDIPYGFLAIYKSAEVVFTDRVHTAACALILGGTARFVFSDARFQYGRWSLLERVGAGDVVRMPTRLDQEAISQEKAEMTAWIASRLV
jgi:hypothetical protein